MPRIARLLPEEGVLHVISRGNNRGLLFHDPEDFKAYLSFLKDLQSDHPFSLYHFCLMNTHVHLLLDVNPNTRLSDFMKRLSLLYTHYYKQKYRHTGHFWENRYKSILVEKDKHLLEGARYIESNPIKAGMVKDPKDWPWSSYNTYAFGESNPLIVLDPLYQDLGQTDLDRQKAYRAFVLKPEGYDEVLYFKRRFFGSEAFVKLMEKQFGIERLPRRRGRPKKNRTVP